MIKAINNTTVEVAFDEEVEDVKALDFAIEGLEITNAAVKQTNKKVVVLTTSAQTADKEYTVTLDGDKIGSFKGISAVVPTKVDIVEKSVQGKLGQQVTVKAQVTVADGASKAGIPVTFFIPGSADGIKAPVTAEAHTDENGVATYSYTRYAATNDTVTTYATGDRSKFSTGYVFWAVDTTLSITEVTEGATINNGANKVYKVTYKDPTTGKPVSGKTLNVSVKENIDVTVDKLQDVTINGDKVAQTSENNTKAAQIKTDSKGEATFTVSGSNAEVTPVVFDAAAIHTTNGNTTTTTYTQKYTGDTIQATAAKVTFGAVQAAYSIEVNRDGGETAATGATNGRKYNVVVKTKDGKLAANETVNVAFNENIDGVISTVTKAKFVKVVDGKQVGLDGDKITVKTNSKGEASFVIGTEVGPNYENTYATPIAWIDINNQSGKDANLDKGEPSTVAPISYFQAEYLDGSKLVSKDAAGEDEDKFVGTEKATFKVELTNQSGKAVGGIGAEYKTENVSYTVYNTGANTVLVEGVEVAPNRVYTLIAPNGEIKVSANEKGESSSVKVLATGVAKHKTEKDFAFTAKEATATFTSTSEVTNLFTGGIKSFNTDKKTIVFTDKAGDKKAIKYAGESDKKYVYKNVNSAPLNETQFVEALKDAKGEVRATYEVKDDVVTFYLLSTDGDADKKPKDELGAGEELKTAKAALDAAIKEVTAKDTSNYNKATVTAVKAAIEAAQKVADKTDATATELNNAVTELNKKVEELLVVANEKPAATKLDTPTITVSGEVVTLTFNSNVSSENLTVVTTEPATSTVARETATVLKATFKEALLVDNKIVVTVKVPATEDNKAGEFTYTFEHDGADWVEVVTP